MTRCGTHRGFSLIEMLVLIVVVGILASVALQSMSTSVEDVRRVRTEREMEMLSKAIVGDPGFRQDNRRSDFGYVGDVGAFPPDLQALYRNPGGYATWDGPYPPSGFAQDSTGFKTDEWGSPYGYSGGITISSTGSGSTVAKKIADATDDYLRNAINGTILDAANDPPGSDYVDSVDVVITYPNGSGAMTSKTYAPDASGAFKLDSIPVGTHLLRLIYTPEVDTLTRYLTVLPRHRSPASYRFAPAYFGGGSGGAALTSEILRPNGAGSITDLTSSGCSDNYLCVDETSSDGDATYVERAASSYATDVYTLDDSGVGSGTVDSVVVHCIARRELLQGDVMPAIYVSGSEYNGAVQSMTDVYAEYQQTWPDNPNTGGEWTWSDIDNLQAGVRIKGQNSNFSALCTQVWVEVFYTN